jgi:hypothetical protein
MQASLSELPPLFLLVHLLIPSRSSTAALSNVLPHLSELNQDIHYIPEPSATSSHNPLDFSALDHLDQPEVSDLPSGEDYQHVFQSTKNITLYVKSMVLLNINLSDM